jgi:hypothetical protein
MPILVNVERFIAIPLKLLCFGLTTGINRCPCGGLYVLIRHLNSRTSISLCNNLEFLKKADTLIPLAYALWRKKTSD